MISDLVNDNEYVVEISFGDETQTNGFSSDVEFNNTEALVVENGLEVGVQSPAIGLIHELGHQKHVKEDQSGTRKRKDTPDSQYDNKEEKKVIEDIETPVVNELNKNGANEGKRNNHSHVEKVKVKCSTCNDI